MSRAVCKKSYKLYAILNDYSYVKNSETGSIHFIHCSVLVLNLCVTFKAEIFVTPDTINLSTHMLLWISNFWAVTATASAECYLDKLQNQSTGTTKATSLFDFTKRYIYKPILSASFNPLKHDIHHHLKIQFLSQKKCIFITLFQKSNETYKYTM
jgi:hypothetical protein